ncbi:MAG: hypothetical protein AAGD38_03810 [Acidobacteriota bacterium]
MFDLLSDSTLPIVLAGLIGFVLGWWLMPRLTAGQRDNSFDHRLSSAESERDRLREELAASERQRYALQRLTDAAASPSRPADPLDNAAIESAAADPNEADHHPPKRDEAID